MFENITYDQLMKEALESIDGKFDKREGSLLYTAQAPAMAEIARLYTALDFVFGATYIATAPREFLIERAADRGIYPKEASRAVFKMRFNTDVPSDSRFSCERYNFAVTEKIGNYSDGVYYKAVCETAGSAPNLCIGTAVPIEYIDGLTKAEITELLIPGDDEEETEAFRERVMNSLQNPSFGGNAADYKSKVLSIDGVEAVKVYPVWNSDISPSALIPGAEVTEWYGNTINTIEDENVKKWLTAVYTASFNSKLTVGGTVRIVFTASGNTVPAQELVNKVQTATDPKQNAGEGLGTAPIGHVVKVDGVKGKSISVSTKLTFVGSKSFDEAKSSIDAAVKGYFKDLAGTWKDSDGITVRISQLESRILSECSDYVADITDTKLCGKAENYVLDRDSIPILEESGVTNED